MVADQAGEQLRPQRGVLIHHAQRLADGRDLPRMVSEHGAQEIIRTVQVHQRQQRTGHLTGICLNSLQQRHPPPQGGGIGIHLNHPAPPRQEIAVGEIRAPHDQHVAIQYGMHGSPPAQQAGHAHGIGVILFQQILGSERVGHRCMKPLGQSHDIPLSPGTANTAEEADTCRSIQ